tara:strand:+ start:292 stop:570 length:279 start_codon:yes stop_codon:yes gene_type:complete
MTTKISHQKQEQITKGFQSESLKKIIKYLESKETYVTPTAIHSNTNVNYSGVVGVLSFLKEMNLIEMSETDSNIILIKYRRHENDTRNSTED